jgi:hypothetical protein
MSLIEKVVPKEQPKVTEEDKISDVMHMDADVFMAEAIVELQDQPLATKRRIAKNIAATAKLYETQAQMNNDRYAAKKWGQIGWSLRTLK